MGNVKKNFIYQVLYQILLIILPLITSPYISRVLGPDGIGIYSYTYSITSVFVIFAKLGIDVYGNRLIASVRNNKERLNQEYSNLYFLHIIVTLLVGIVYAIYCFEVANNYIDIFFIQGLLILAELFDINWLFFGLEEFRLTVIRSTFVRTVCTILIFVFVNKKGEVDVYTALLATSAVATQVIMHLFKKGRVKFVRPDFAALKIHLKGMIVFFVPAVAVSIFKIMDKTMLGILATTTDVGYYENTEKIINMALALITALGTVMMPRITNMLSTGDKDSTNAIFRKTMKFTFIGIMAIAGGLIGVSNTFPVVFWGESFSICQYLLIGLSISLPFTAVANVIRTQYLIPFHHDRDYVVSVISGTIVNVIGNAVMIPMFKSMGAVISTIMAECMVFLVQASKCRDYVNISKEITQLISYTILGIIMSCIVWLIGNVSGAQIYTLLIQIFVGMIIYISGTLIIAKLKNDEEILQMIHH